MGASEVENVRDGVGGSGPIVVPGPLVVPTTVGIGMAKVSGREGIPAFMAIVMDLERVPGLTEAVDRHRKGEEFDVETQWAVVAPLDDPNGPPAALLMVHMPQLELRFSIEIDVDEYSAALMVAARTNHMGIVDAGLEHDLRRRDIGDVLENGRSMGFTAEDAEPLLRVLLQRLDISPKGFAEDGVVDEGDAEFLAEAKPAELLTILAIPSYPPTAVLVDSEVGDLRARLGSELYFKGHWTVRTIEGDPVARLDCVLDDERIASWLLSDPSEEMVRMTATGGHGIVVVSKPVSLRGGDMAILSRVAQGVPVFSSAATDEMLKILEARAAG